MGSEGLSDVVLAEAVGRISNMMIGDDTKFDKPGLGRDLVDLGGIPGVFNFDGFVLAFRFAVQHGVVEVPPSGLVPPGQVLLLVVLESNGHRKGRCLWAVSPDVEHQFETGHGFGVDGELVGHEAGSFFHGDKFLIASEGIGRFVYFYEVFSLFLKPRFHFWNSEGHKFLRLHAISYYLLLDFVLQKLTRKSMINTGQQMVIQKVDTADNVIYRDGIRMTQRCSTC